MAKILVVEDNPMNMELVVDVLEAEGYEVEKANNGPESLEMVKNDLFDLILLDIQMPEMDGIEVLENLKKSEETKDIPVISITAHEMKGMMVLPTWKWQDEDKFISVGCDDYIAKPIDIDDFLKKIKKYT